MKALSTFLRREIEVIGAGRTDAGVHARGMVANAVFDATDKERGGRERTPDEIRDYMNRYLPDDIAVKEVEKLLNGFMPDIKL